MSEQATLPRAATAEATRTSAKRRQIIEGARAVFLAQGFDAASMNDIARAAGVSKGTLYVYFENKEQLFEAIVEEECDAQAEGIFDLDPDDHDVEAVLTRLGVAYVKFLCRPEKASAIRTVIAIADRMPEVGRKFYESGPACGIARLAAYLAAQVEAGVLAVEDCEDRRRAVHGIDATPCCSSRSCSTSRRRRARSRSSAASALPLRCSSPPTGTRRRIDASPRWHGAPGDELFGRFAVDRISHVRFAALPIEGVVGDDVGAVRQRHHGVADDFLLAR